MGDQRQGAWGWEDVAKKKGLHMIDKSFIGSQRDVKPDYSRETTWGG